MNSQVSILKLSVRVAMTLHVATLLGSFSLWAAIDPPLKSQGTVTGTVRMIRGDHTVVVANRRLSFIGSRNTEGRYETVTNELGQYTVELPGGTYRAYLHWGGECPEVHRAEFRINQGEHFVFDYIVVFCGILDTEKADFPWEEVRSAPKTDMNIPFAKQKEGYREQVFPSENDQRPEVVISFGRYDHQDDQTKYFPLQNVRVKTTPGHPVMVPMPMPVTITVDRYTVRALTVTLDEKTMVFQADGDVVVSDGNQSVAAKSATLSFSNGRPKLAVNL